jgi:hypothetical protein
MYEKLGAFVSAHPGVLLAVLFLAFLFLVFGEKNKPLKLIYGIAAAVTAVIGMSLV